MNPLARLHARITELHAARGELEATLSGVERVLPTVGRTDWESRLSAARAVDALTGSTTAAALDAQRAAEERATTKAAAKAAESAHKATQTREAIESLTRDLDAATALLQRSLAEAARGRLPDRESRYHRALDEWTDAAADLAGALSLSGRETEAHQLLRSVGVPGDTMTVMGQRANLLRERLLNEEEPDHA